MLCTAHDIPNWSSQVKTWDKVNSGMIKMYEAEVLGKLPVIQHFLFGSLLPWDGPLVSSSVSEAEDDCGHKHDVSPAQLAHVHPSRLGEAAHTHGDLGGAGQREVGWGDCCGIPVPSVFAAAQAEKEKQAAGGLRLGGPNIRPVPFD